MLWFFFLFFSLDVVILVWCRYFATLKGGFCHSSFPVQGGAFIHMRVPAAAHQHLRRHRFDRATPCFGKLGFKSGILCTKLSLVSTMPVKEELEQINSALALHGISKSGSKDPHAACSALCTNTCHLPAGTGLPQGRGHPGQTSPAAAPPRRKRAPEN